MPGPSDWLGVAHANTDNLYELTGERARLSSTVTIVPEPILRGH